MKSLIRLLKYIVKMLGQVEERSFKWQEITACPEQIIKTLGNGKVKMVDTGEK